MFLFTKISKICQFFAPPLVPLKKKSKLFVDRFCYFWSKKEVFQGTRARIWGELGWLLPGPDCPSTHPSHDPLMSARSLDRKHFIYSVQCSVNSYMSSHTEQCSLTFLLSQKVTNYLFQYRFYKVSQIHHASKCPSSMSFLDTHMFPRRYHLNPSLGAIPPCNNNFAPQNHKTTRISA